MEEKYIFRTKAEKEFTTIRNKLITDKSLTWEARGLLIYLLSKSDTWIVRKTDLIAMSPAAGKKTASILKELETAGYIKRNKFRNDKGQWEWHTWVYDVPQPLPILPKRGDGSTILPKTTHGLSTPGNGANIVSTELKKTEIENTEKTIKDTLPYSVMLELWLQLFPDKPQPRAGTVSVRNKIRARWKDEWFRENWKEAMTRASESKTLHKESWFTFQFFVKNEDNPQKCYDRWMAWKDGNNGKENRSSNSEPGEMYMSDEEAVRRLKEQGLV